MSRPLNFNTPQTPIASSDLKDDVKVHFDSLIEAASAIDWDANEAVARSQCEEYHKTLQRLVTEHSSIVRAIDVGRRGWSLLAVVCENLERECGLETVKFLVHMNPSALLWPANEENPIVIIARDQVLSLLMPWIATNFAWVLDHERSLSEPPSVHLALGYSNGNVTTDTCRRFFEIFPKGLSQQCQDGEGLPIYIIVHGDRECDAELVEWMGQTYPEGMRQRYRRFPSLLHMACVALVNSGSDNMLQICTFIVDRCPELVREPLGEIQILPIHAIVDEYKTRNVQKLMIRLLREYPESYNMSAFAHRAPSSSPFLQRVKPFLDEEAQVKSTSSMLRDMSSKLREATVYSINPLHPSVSDVFGLWVATRAKRLEDRLKDMLAAIDQISDEFEEEPEDQEEDFEDDDDDVMSFEGRIGDLNVRFSYGSDFDSEDEDEDVYVVY